MNKSIKIFSSFILALSQMFSFAPKENYDNQQDNALGPFNPSIRESFQSVWGYIEKAVKNEQKQ